MVLAQRQKAVPGDRSPRRHCARPRPQRLQQRRRKSTKKIKDTVGHGQRICQNPSLKGHLVYPQASSSACVPVTGLLPELCPQDSATVKVWQHVLPFIGSMTCHHMWPPRLPVRPAADGLAPFSCAAAGPVGVHPRGHTVHVPMMTRDRARLCPRASLHICTAGDRLSPTRFLAAQARHSASIAVHALSWALGVPQQGRQGWGQGWPVERTHPDR